MQDTELFEFVTSFFSLSVLERFAKPYAFIKRRRKLHFAPLVWTLLLAPFCQHNRSITDWYRLFCLTSGCTLSYSSFYDRLTPDLASFFSDLLAHLLAARHRARAHWLEPFLQDFDRIVAADSSVIALRDVLRESYTACAKTRSALKLHAVVNVLSMMPESLHVTGQTTADIKGLRWLRQCARKRLWFLDLGCYIFALVHTIDHAGGFFVSRGKSNFNPVLLQDYYVGPGQPAQVQGRKLRAVLPHLKRSHLDALVALTSQDGKTFSARVIAQRDEEGKWRVYLTNLHPGQYPAQEISQLYRLRWQVELVFKQLKSDQHIDLQTSGKKHLVQMKIDVILIGYVVTGRLCEELEKKDSIGTYLLSRGLRTLKTCAIGWLLDMCASYRSGRANEQLLMRLIRDPNQSRVRGRDPAVRTSRLADFY